LNPSIDLQNEWRVQVASLGNIDNVNRLIGEIEALGISAQSQTITSNGVSLHRVIAGPFDDETQAQLANTGIRSADSRLNPQVLGPVNVAASTGSNTRATTGAAQQQATSTQPQGLDRYAVQVGVFSSGENADNLVTRLNNAGYAAYSERVESNGQSLFRVRIGPLLSDSDASSIAIRIERDLGVNGIVVDYPR